MRRVKLTKERTILEKYILIEFNYHDRMRYHLFGRHEIVVFYVITLFILIAAWGHGRNKIYCLTLIANECKT